MKPWGGVLNEGISPGGKAAAKSVLNLGEEFALALQKSRILQYKNFRGAVTTKVINDFEKKAGLYLINKSEHRMFCVGDDSVRKFLSIPENHPVAGVSSAPDYVSVSKSGKLVISEAKGVVSGDVDVGTAVKQLRNAMDKLIENNLIGDVERAQVIKPAGAKLRDNFTVKDGYLINGEGKTVTMPGKPNFFVRVVEI